MSGDGCSAACLVEPGYACSGSPSVCARPVQTSLSPGDWTWAAGSDVTGAQPTGARGVPSPDAAPWSSVGGGATWVDASGRLWLFGGFANVLGGPTGYLADLWMLEGGWWTWVAGPGTLDASGVYGTLGVPDAANWPGGRAFAASWVDGNGDFWMFGGGGLDAAGGVGNLNDLWRFDGARWAWMGGSPARFDVGRRGTPGVPSPDNVPEARLSSTSWIDAQGDAWIFGGQGQKGGVYGEFNDLWRFDGTAWTWMAGPSGYDDPGSYGTRGLAAASNVPPARFGAAGWVDRQGAFWLFGGYTDDDGSTFGDLNDVWRFDGTSWTWMLGSSGVGAATVFGTQGVPDPANTPGARRECVAWTGAGGALWLFGGGGYVGELNQLWRFDGAAWTFVGGATTPDPLGAYGSRGVPADGNWPGGRTSAVGWVDRQGDLWLFGGLGIGREPVLGALNDLWGYRARP